MEDALRAASADTLKRITESIQKASSTPPTPAEGARDGSESGEHRADADAAAEPNDS